MIDLFENLAKALIPNTRINIKLISNPGTLVVVFIKE